MNSKQLAVSAILRPAVGASWIAAVVCALAITASAQNGDRPGEVEPDLPADLVVPTAPALSPADEAKTFVLPDGFRIELVASEPLIESPVQAVFDEDGRLWVVEMRGFMPDVDGHGEREPIGRISILTDADGDGRMDKAVVFLDHLVLPRSVAPTRGGALVIAPPKVLFCRDTDGDGASDEQTVVDTGIAGIDSPEYGPNGLLPTIDNAFACANHELRYRFVNNQWIKQRTLGGGQWGITLDDVGRIYTNNNSDFLRGDFVDSSYLAKSPGLDAGPLVNAAVATDQSTHPSRITPGVNRAYKDGWLDHWKLKHSDAACAPFIYRGGAFSAEYQGNAFICEPSGNLVKCMRFEEKPPYARSAHSAWPDRDFLTSTDERFRPVNLASGPDGALYVVDMYRGLIQHRNFVTTFLRKQVLARSLEKPIDRGRIWRVVRTDAKREKAPALSKLDSEQLAQCLESPNGWLRDTAQRLFVEGDWDRGPVLMRLRDMAVHAKSNLTRIHALWALEGVDGVDDPTLTATLQDRDTDVRIAALRCSEPLLEAHKDPPIAYLISCTMNTEPRLALQAFLSLSGRIDVGLLAGIILRDASNLESRRAVVAGVAGHEFEHLSAMLLSLTSPDHRMWDEGKGRAELMKMMAAAIVRGGRTQDLDALLENAISRAVLADWARIALIEGALAGRGKGPHGEPARIRLSSAPTEFYALMARADEATRSMCEELLDALAWPGRTDIPAEEIVRKLDESELPRFEKGREVFATICAGCHQFSGLGEPGKAPPLRNSEYVLQDPVRLASILLSGVEGPITLDGKTWDLSMPAWNGRDDELAGVLTYVRREWGHGADPVTQASVRKAREIVKERKGPFRVEELKAFKAPKTAEKSAENAPATSVAEIALCNGRDLAGWRAIGDAKWSVEDGAIHGQRGGGAQSFLATEKMYGDFELNVDVKLLGPGNSGIQIRSHQDDKKKVFGYQIEIDPSERAWSGGLYDEGRRGWLQDLSKNEAGRKALKGDAWNHYRIVCDGTHIRAWVNGFVTTDWIDPIDLDGFIALQVHGGQDTSVLWKNLKLVDRGLRTWRSWFTADEWKATKIGENFGRMLGRGEIGDGAVKVRAHGLEWTLCLHLGDGLQGHEEIVPGILSDLTGWSIRPDHLGIEDGKRADADREFVFSLVGHRLVIHVDGKLVTDVRGQAPERGPVMIRSAAMDSGFELMGGEILSEPQL